MEAGGTCHPWLDIDKRIKSSEREALRLYTASGAPFLMSFVPAPGRRRRTVDDGLGAETALLAT